MSETVQEQAVATKRGEWNVRKRGEVISIVDEQGRERHRSRGHMLTAAYYVWLLAEQDFQSHPTMDEALKRRAEAFLAEHCDTGGYKPCSHNWVSARNEVVTSGEVCTECGAIRAEGDPAPSDEVSRLRSQLSAVQGALADAGTVLAERTDGDYGASVRQLVEERDALRQQLAAAEALLPATFYAARPLAERLGYMVDHWRKAVQGINDREEQLAAAEAEKGRLREACKVYRDIALKMAAFCFRIHGSDELSGSHKGEAFRLGWAFKEIDRRMKDAALTPQPGDGSPLPAGVWAEFYKGRIQLFVRGPRGKTLPGCTYTYIGPVPQETRDGE